MNFEEWQQSVPASIREDSLWKFQTYPRALFLYELTWRDCEKLMKDLRGEAVAKQLIRSSGSISANLEESYGRGFGKDYAYFQRIALGSARESRGWYFRARNILSKNVVEHRMKLLDEIIGLLVSSSQTQYHTKRKSK
jgi:four helix bundle protein